MTRRVAGATRIEADRKRSDAGANSHGRANLTQLHAFGLLKESSVRYDVHVNTLATGVVHAADCMVEERGGVVERVAFRYRPDYLARAGAFALDPQRLPLATGDVVLPCRGGIPALIDDTLPDSWGRAVLATLARFRDGRRLNINSGIDVLSLVGGSRIGALSFARPGETRRYEPGHPMDTLVQGERTATRLDAADWHDVDSDAASVLHLANAGSGVGGARPKMLIFDGARGYLAKFNRRGDGYNNARVELACSRMARAAGLTVADGGGVDGSRRPRGVGHQRSRRPAA